MRIALGMVETLGLVAAIEAADAMVKTADVKILPWKKAEGGLVSVRCRGSVGAVMAATEAGAQAARKVGTLWAVKVIPAPYEETEIVI